MNNQFYAARYNLSNNGDANSYQLNQDHFPGSESYVNGPISAEITPKNEQSQANIRNDRLKKLGRPVTAN